MKQTLGWNALPTEHAYATEPATCFWNLSARQAKHWHDFRKNIAKTPRGLWKKLKKYRGVFKGMRRGKQMKGLRMRRCMAKHGRLGAFLALTLLACDLLGEDNNLCGDLPDYDNSSQFAKTCLGSAADELAALSPSLEDSLQKLEKDGWKIQYKTGGSIAEIDKKRISINSSLKEKPTALIQELAHETGHAITSYKPDYHSKETYVRSMLASEGAATLNGLIVQHEILAKGGPDIGVSGNGRNYEKYQEIYERYRSAQLSEDAACKEIGEIFRHGEKPGATGGVQTYEQYYGDWYELYGDRHKRNGISTVIQPLL